MILPDIKLKPIFKPKHTWLSRIKCKFDYHVMKLDVEYKNSNGWTMLYFCKHCGKFICSTNRPNSEMDFNPASYVTVSEIDTDRLVNTVMINRSRVPTEEKFQIKDTHREHLRGKYNNGRRK